MPSLISLFKLFRRFLRNAEIQIEPENILGRQFILSGNLSDHTKFKILGKVIGLELLGGLTNKSNTLYIKVNVTRIRNYQYLDQVYYDAGAKKWHAVIYDSLLPQDPKKSRNLEVDFEIF